MAGGFSSLRNATARREHKERGQLQKRKHKGLLEKKKDYRVRADNYKMKKKIISTLKQKANFRNPDEFYFAMNSMKTKDGVHDSDNARKNNKSHEEISILKEQDRAYLKLKKATNDKSIEKLQQSLHLLENVKKIEVVRGCETNKAEAVKIPPTKTYHANEKSKRNHHKIFLDSKEDVESFDPVLYFGTSRGNLSQIYNRKRVGNYEEENSSDNQGSESDVESTNHSDENQEEDIDLKIDNNFVNSKRRLRETKNRPKMHNSSDHVKPIFDVKGVDDSRPGRASLLSSNPSIVSDQRSNYSNQYFIEQDRQSMTKINKYRKSMYRELEERQNRSKVLEKTIQHLDLEHNLMGKGQKMKIKDETSDGNAAQWVWKRERKGK